MMEDPEILLQNPQKDSRKTRKPIKRREEACRIESVQGPFPDPTQLAAYEEAAPGTAEFILKEAARAERVRQEAFLSRERAQDQKQSIRIAAALVACVLAMATGSVTLLEGMTYEGLALSGSGLIGLVLAFIKASDFQENSHHK